MIAQATVITLLLIFSSLEADGAVVVCEPNVKVMRGCNTCVCNESGSSLLCNNLMCAPDMPSIPPPAGFLVGEEAVCQAGTVFSVQCNTCRCSQMGTEIACTRKLCIQ